MQWPEALDAFEASLDAHHDALVGVGSPPSVILGHEDLGPLPLELRARAQYLVGRCRRLEGQLVAAEQAVTAALAALEERRRPGPAYLDMTL